MVEQETNGRLNKEDQNNKNHGNSRQSREVPLPPRGPMEEKTPLNPTTLRDSTERASSVQKGRFLVQKAPLEVRSSTSSGTTIASQQQQQSNTSLMMSKASLEKETPKTVRKGSVQKGRFLVQQLSDGESSVVKDAGNEERASATGTEAGQRCWLNCFSSTAVSTTTTNSHFFYYR